MFKASQHRPSNYQSVVLVSSGQWALRSLHHINRFTAEQNWRKNQESPGRRRILPLLSLLIRRYSLRQSRRCRRRLSVEKEVIRTRPKTHRHTQRERERERERERKNRLQYKNTDRRDRRLTRPRLPPPSFSGRFDTELRWRRSLFYPPLLIVSIWIVLHNISSPLRVLLQTAALSLDI